MTTSSHAPQAIPPTAPAHRPTPPWTPLLLVSTLFTLAWFGLQPDLLQFTPIPISDTGDFSKLVQVDISASAWQNGIVCLRFTPKPKVLTVTSMELTIGKAPLLQIQDLETELKFMNGGEKCIRLRQPIDTRELDLKDLVITHLQGTSIQPR